MGIMKKLFGYFLLWLSANGFFLCIGLLGSGGDLLFPLVVIGCINVMSGLFYSGGKLAGLWL